MLRPSTILPNGLILKFPPSGVLTDVTIPAILIRSFSVVPVTWTNSPLEFILTKSPSLNEE